MNDKRTEPAIAKDASQARTRNRRRFLQGGVGATPLLMTLVSKPVLGQTACYSCSAHASMPTSHRHVSYCSGRTPEYWANPDNFGQWPYSYCPVTTTTSVTVQATCFEQMLSPSAYVGGTTCLSVLQMPAAAPNNVSRYMVASVLNVAKGWVPVLNMSVLQTIWLEYMNTGGLAGGYYTPTAGVKWYHDDIVAYLQSTTPL